MSSPEFPIRLEFSVEVDGPPDAVWAALATGAGLSSWFVTTDVDERAGGALVAHMGEMDMPAWITEWDPPRRLVYEEREWARLMGYPDADVTPLVSEFLVEARSGGTCVVRVVSSAFGTGAEWEREAADGMAEGWIPFFEHLRLYVAHFAGQRARTFTADSSFTTGVEELRAAVRCLAGDAGVGGTLELEGRNVIVEQVTPAPLFRLERPVQGFVRCWAWPNENGAWAQALGYVFGADEATTEAERKAWTSVLDSLAVEATR